MHRGALATGLVVVAMGLAPAGGRWWARLPFVVVGLLVAWLALVRVRVDHDGVHLQRTGRWRTYRWHDEVVAVGWQPDAGRRRLLVACIVARPKPLVLAPVRSGDAAEVARRLEAIDAVAPSGCVRVDDAVVEPSGVLAWWARHPRAAK